MKFLKSSRLLFLPELWSPPGPNVPKDKALVLFLICCTGLCPARAAAIDLGTNSGISGMMLLVLTSGCEEGGGLRGGKSADRLLGRKSGGGTPGGGGPGGGGPLWECGRNSLMPLGGAVFRAPGINSMACGLGPCKNDKNEITYEKDHKSSVCYYATFCT